jgi:hypothetical protein
MIFVFFASLINGSDRALVGFSITPDQYVDSTQWLDQVKKKPADFPTHTLNLNNCPLLASLLARGMHDVATWPTKLEPTYIARLKEHAVYENQTGKHFASEMKAPHYTSYVCFITSLQLYKLVNRLQLETGYYFANREGKQLDDAFAQIKEGDFDRVTSNQFYEKITQDGKRFLGASKSDELFTIIKNCDDRLCKVESSLEYSNVVVTSMRDCFTQINMILLKDNNAYSMAKL